VVRPGLPRSTRFFAGPNYFLGYADLQRSAEILLHSTSRPVLCGQRSYCFLFYLSTGVRAKWATASSSCCFDDFPLRLHLFMSLRPDSVGSWSVFFDMGFRSSALHTAFLKDTFAADNRANWGWRLHFCFL
jgi:hypothetical protein